MVNRRLLLGVGQVQGLGSLVLVVLQENTEITEVRAEGSHTWILLRRKEWETALHSDV